MEKTSGTTESEFIRKIYFKYMLASLMGNVLSSLGQIINSALLGNMLSAEALSVIAVCAPLDFSFMAIAALIIMGGIALCSRYTGQGQQEKSDKSFTAAMALTVMATAAVSAIMLIFRVPIVNMMCPIEELWSDVNAYYTIMACGGVFYSVGQVATVNFLRQDGKPEEMTVVSVLYTVINIALCYFLVSSGTMGAAAAAVGKVVGSAFMAAALTVTIAKRGATVHFVRMSLGEIFGCAREIIMLGTTCFLENASFTLRSVCLNAILASSFGTLSLAAFGIIGSMIGIQNVMIYGIAAAALPFIGVFVAERDSASVRRILKQVIKTGALIALPATALCMIFSAPIARFFGMTDPDELAAAIPAVRIFCLCFFPGIINYTITALHMNNNHVVLANILTVCRLFAYGVLTSLCLKGVLGADAVWHSFWIAEVLTFATALVLQSFIAKKDPALSPLTLLNQKAEREGSSISIPVRNTKEGIAQACEKARAFAEEHGLGRRGMYLCLAVEEILLSLSSHALEGNEKADVDVYILLDKGDVLLRFRTAGKMFDPVSFASAHKPAAQAESADDFEAISAQAALDACEVVQYTTTFGVNNLTVIQRERRGAAAEA